MANLTGTGTYSGGAVKPDAITVDGYESALFAHRYTKIPSNMQMRIDWTSGNADYVGYAPKDLTSSTQGWLLQKFTYDDSGRCTLRQIAFDSWDDRATASYG